MVGLLSGKVALPSFCTTEKCLPTTLADTVDGLKAFIVRLALLVLLILPTWFSSIFADQWLPVKSPSLATAFQD